MSCNVNASTVAGPNKAVPTIEADLTAQVKHLGSNRDNVRAYY